uniref:ATP synthase subunit I n=1 Tax=Acetatifactor sp. TaxID=1872090 RepID=UPI0040577D15
MQIFEKLKKINRTLLEMLLGLLFWGMACQIVGAFFVANQLYYAKSLWFGILLAMISAVHMYQSLDRALDFSEKEANKLIFRGYVIRYVSIVIILFIIMLTEIMNPLVVFLAYMGLKVAAFLQPITHKICNKISKGR